MLPGSALTLVWSVLKEEARLCSEAFLCWEAVVGTQAWGLSLDPEPGGHQGLGAGSLCCVAVRASSLAEGILLLWGVP